VCAIYLKINKLKRTCSSFAHKFSLFIRHSRILTIKRGLRAIKNKFKRCTWRICSTCSHMCAWKNVYI